MANSEKGEKKMLENFWQKYLENLDKLLEYYKYIVTVTERDGYISIYSYNYQH